MNPEIVSLKYESNKRWNKRNITTIDTKNNNFNTIKTYIKTKG